MIKRLGFAGVYIDRRGFKDNAESLIAQLIQLLGAGPTFTRADGEVVFFKLEPIMNVDLSKLTNTQIKKAGYEKI